MIWRSQEISSDVKSAGIARVVGVPHGFEKELAREQLAGVTQENLQQSRLFGRDPRLTAGAGHLALG